MANKKTFTECQALVVFSVASLCFWALTLYMLYQMIVGGRR